MATNPKKTTAPNKSAAKAPTKPAAKIAAKPAAKVAAKPAAKSKTLASAPAPAPEAVVTKSKPAPKAAAAKAPAPKPKAAPVVITRDDIALRAYFIAERRNALGLPGDEHQDWLAAEAELTPIREAKQRKS